MEWDIVGDKVRYTCTMCSWFLEPFLGKRAEPFREFEKHVCAEHPVVKTSKVN